MPAPMPTLYVLTGLPGSGKSTHATALVEATGAAHVAMDDAVLAHGLSLVDYEARFALQPEVEASIPALLRDGRSVVAEFGSWAREERERLRHLADGTGARVELHWVDAPVAVCMERVLARGGPDAESLARDILGANAHLYEAPDANEAAGYDAFRHVQT